MAIGLPKSTTLVAITKEITEGVPVEPTVGTEFITILQDGLSFTPAKELVERNILSENISMATPRTSTKSVSAELPLELKASGTEGDAPNWGVLLESLLGGFRQVGTRVTTTSSGTTTQAIATGHGLLQGDFGIFLTAGEHHAAFVTNVVDVDTFDFSPPAPNAIGSGIDFTKSTTYFGTNTDQIPLTATVYWSDEVKEQGAGFRATSMSLENFTTGQIANANFALEGLTFERTDASAGVTPTPDSNLPPIVLGAIVSINGVCFDLNEIGFTIENTQAFLTSVKDQNGRVSSSITNRGITGSMAPYLDDADTTLFDAFNDDAKIELIITLGIPSTTDGELILGSSFGIYFPQVLFTADAVSDLDELLTEEIEFSANSGSDGSLQDVFISFS